MAVPYPMLMIAESKLIAALESLTSLTVTAYAGPVISPCTFAVATIARTLGMDAVTLPPLPKDAVRLSGMAASVCCPGLGAGDDFAVWLDDPLPEALELGAALEVFDEGRGA